MADALPQARPPAVESPHRTVAYASLSKVMERLEVLLKPALDRAFWLRAEISSGNERRGAFYCDLVETDAQGAVRAKLRCTIWAKTLERIRTRFARAGLELVLANGTSVGVQCAVQFHATHGLSLNVLDMDPAFALGELELRRRQILERLRTDGLLERNGRLAVPLLPSRILLITSGASAAFADFTRALAARPAFGFRLLLADTLMQGPQAERALLRALGLARPGAVDLVVLIRGGGSKTDLGWLDSEAVARAIAALPVPLWTGIGHETDHSVLDAVAGQSCRTPTAVAEALLARFERVQQRTGDAQARLRIAFGAARHAQGERLARKLTGLRQGTRKLLAVRRAELGEASGHLRVRVLERLGRAHTGLARCAHELQSAARTRLFQATGALRAERSRLTTAAARALERTATALRFGRERFAGLHLADRFAAEHARLERKRTGLRQGTRKLLAVRRGELHTGSAQLRLQLAERLAQARLVLERSRHRFARAGALRLGSAALRTQALREHLRAASGRRLQRALAALAQTRRRFSPLRARRRLERELGALAQTRQRFSPLRARRRLERERAALAERSRALRAADPAHVLARGFSLTRSACGKLLRCAADLQPGTQTITQLADGQFSARVERILAREDRDVRTGPE